MNRGLFLFLLGFSTAALLLTVTAYFDIHNPTPALKQIVCNPETEEAK